MENCVFCKIIKGELPKTLVFENESVLVIKSVAPVADIHFLIIPKKHNDSFLELDDETVSNLKNIAQQIILEQKLESGYKLVINGGKYQAIEHFHWHLLAGKFMDEKDAINRT